ncbi:MAG: hypothetical protein ACFFBZ_13810 [Promethearchaeota archaeon]
MEITEFNHYHEFLEALHFLKHTYKKFPKFMIEIVAENYGIPPQEVKELIPIFIRNGILKILKNEGYYYELDENL